MLRGNSHHARVGAAFVLLILASQSARAEDGKTKGTSSISSTTSNNTTASMGSMQSAPNELAAVAYDRGAAAFDAKDYVRAADEFSRADTLAPNTLALQLALDSAMRAGRAAMVMDLTARAEARLAAPRTGGANATGERIPALTALVARAHAEFEERAGTLTIQCPAPRVCTARVDDRIWPVNSRTWIGVGRHVLSMRIDGREEHRDFVILPRESIELKPEPSPNVAQTPSSKNTISYPVTQGNPAINQQNSKSSRSMSPTWFWVGVSATAVLGGLAIASGIDTNAKHNEFELNRTADRASEGRGAQTRTNVLLGLTAIGAVASATLAIFFVDWSHHRTPGRASTPRTTLGLGSCLTLTTTY
ncbi:hypothetical protein [Pendulispora albinea]|uniref:Tetratricopeptide repeat protein n=1 Tax=Pendulispora albinea TaxID=2741071 RepID=A0ABZ2M0U6_9BACT